MPVRTHWPWGQQGPVHVNKNLPAAEAGAVSELPMGLCGRMAQPQVLHSRWGGKAHIPGAIKQDGILRVVLFPGTSACWARWGAWGWHLWQVCGEAEKRREDVFAQVSVFLKHGNYQLWRLMAGLKGRQRFTESFTVGVYYK